MSKLDEQTRRLLGSIGLYEDWGASYNDAKVKAEPVRAAGPFKQAYAIMESAEDLDPDRAPGQELLKEKGTNKLDPKVQSRLKGILGKKDKNNDEGDRPRSKGEATPVAEMDKKKDDCSCESMESVMDIIRQRMGLDEGRYCGCGCMGEGHCAAMKAQMEAVTARNSKDARHSHLQRLVSEKYDPDMKEMRRSAGIISEQVDQQPPTNGRYVVSRSLPTDDEIVEEAVKALKDNPLW